MHVLHRRVRRDQRGVSGGGRGGLAVADLVNLRQAEGGRLAWGKGFAGMREV